MKKIKKIIIFLSVFLILVVPIFSFAQGQNPPGLVPCDNSTGNLCDFDALMALINTIVHFILFYMAVPIAAIMFAYAGFLMVTAGGEAAGARTKAKSIFSNTLLGLIIAVAAWLIINTVLSILGWEGSWIGFVRPTP